MEQKPAQTGVVVVGGGMAGLIAACYLARARPTHASRARGTRDDQANHRYRQLMDQETIGVPHVYRLPAMIRGAANDRADPTHEP